MVICSLKFPFPFKKVWACQFLHNASLAICYTDAQLSYCEKTDLAFINTGVSLSNTGCDVADMG